MRFLGPDKGGTVSGMISKIKEVRLIILSRFNILEKLCKIKKECILPKKTVVQNLS